MSKKFFNKCRFGYPFPLETKTRIHFTETEISVRAEIFLKRNDSFMNMHNRSICHCWRGNVDLQIILDQNAAVNYMVKYATKSEKTGKTLKQIYKDIISPCTENDNANSKIRSLMIHSVAGNRDIGQCEVSRLLFSDPLYHSTFTYVIQSSDIYCREINLIELNNDQAIATKPSMIDFYRHRKSNEALIPHLHRINNLVEFVKMFVLVRNELKPRESSDNIVVTFYPRVRYNPENIDKHKEYCYHQLIRYSSWDNENYDEITNANTAIQRWTDFLKSAAPEIIASIK